MRRQLDMTGPITIVQGAAGHAVGPFAHDAKASMTARGTASRIQQGVNGSPKVAAMEHKFPSFPHTVFVKYIEPDISSFLTFNQEADRSQGHQLLAYNTFSCDPKTSGQGCSYSIPR